MIPERLLLGPGPSPVSVAVQRAMTLPVLGHLDPAFLAVLDEVRMRLGRVFRAADGSLALAVSGTGTAGLEASVANTVAAGSRVVSVVNGYFGERIAHTCERYGARVTRVEGEWGRACDVDMIRRALRAGGADVVTAVHAETSTGVVNPVRDLAAAARETGALVIVDAVTSLGAMPVDLAAWQIDVCYSCTQKGLGAPPGLAPLAFGPGALARRTDARSFYLDLRLLEEYWVNRKYHHTISSPLIYALREALTAVEEEGLEARWTRHERHHRALAAGLEAMGLQVLPPPGERLWSLNAVQVPDGVDEGVVRRHLLEVFSIEIGAGLGPLAGRIWRIGLMGAGANASAVLVVLAALEHALAEQGRRTPAGQGTAAALGVLTGSV